MLCNKTSIINSKINSQINISVEYQIQVLACKYSAGERFVLINNFVTDLKKREIMLPKYGKNIWDLSYSTCD